MGEAVRTFKEGDRDATYAQWVVVDAAVVTHLPDEVDLVDAAAIPLVTLTGDPLVRLATRVRSGQTFVVSGALGSVGRAAVHTATKLGARVIAGVRTRQLAEARRLNVFDVIAIDDEEALARLGAVDAVADTVGGEIAAKLFRRVKEGGSFGFASVLPEGTAMLNPSVTIRRVFAKPDASKVREFSDDLRDGKFELPMSQRMPLSEVARGHALMEKGGAGKIILVMPPASSGG